MIARIKEGGWSIANVQMGQTHHTSQAFMGQDRYRYRQGRDRGLTVSEEVSLSRHVIRKHSTADAHWPEELIDVI